MKWTAERILANSDFNILLSWMFFPYLSYTCPTWTYTSITPKYIFYCTIIPLLVHIVLCNVLFFSEVCRKKNFYKRLFLLVSHRTIMLLSGLRINLLALLHSVGTEYNFWTIKYAIYLLNWAFFATSSFLVKFVKKVCVLHTYNNEHFFSWKQSIKVQV